MARARGRIPYLAIPAALLVLACTELTVNSLDPTVTPPPTEITLAIPSPPVGTSPPVSQSPDVSPATCTDFFTPPPYDAFSPVPGISVRTIDKGHFEITNATSRDYYFGATFWVTEDNLVCGRGVTDHSAPGGRVPRGSTVAGLGGSTLETPLTVSIWASPCGDGCYRDPIGKYVVPVSSVEPPSPGST
jgi:hypothetical protein